MTSGSVYNSHMCNGFGWKTVLKYSPTMESDSQANDMTVLSELKDAHYKTLPHVFSYLFCIYY